MAAYAFLCHHHGYSGAQSPGYAAASEELIGAINAVQGHSTSNTCSIAQYAALEALKGPQESVEAMRLEYDKRRVVLVEGLNRIAGISCVNANGAFYLMPNVSSYYGKTDGKRRIRDSFDMAEYLLDEAHVAVVPGAAFEAPDNIRIAYSNSMENIRLGLVQMSAALEKLR